MSGDGHQEQTGKLSRRDFIKIAGLTGAGFGAAALYAQLRGFDVLGWVTKLADIPSGNEGLVESSGIKIRFTSQGIPEGYTMPDGSQGLFDQAKALETRNRAIKNNDPEVLDILTRSDFISPAATKEKLPEHPLLTAIPDVMSSEELKQQGVEIIQPTKTQLYVRKTAFQDGEPLAEMRKKGTKIKIVLVDGPRAGFNYINSPPYPEDIVRLAKSRLVGTDFTDQRDKEIRTLNNSLQLARETLKKAQQEKNQDIEVKTVDAIASIKSRATAISTATEAELRVIFRNTSLFGFAGQYVTPEEYQLIEPDSKNTAVVFIPAGLERTYVGKVILTAKPDGSFAVYSMNHSVTVSDPNKYDATPKANQSYLDPVDLHFNPNPQPSDSNSYIVVDPRPIGYALRHELNHFFYDRDEYKTDTLALDGVKKAWNTWKSSNYTDNSGYYLGFSLPEGGFIVS